MPVVLYNVPGSPPCGFVRALAKLIGVELELRNLDLRKKEHLTPEYLKLNPFHTVPTIHDTGFVVYESAAIAYYLLRKYAPNSELYPECVKQRTRIDQILAAVTGTIQRHKTAFFVPRFVKKTNPSKEEVAACEENVLKGYEHLIGEGAYAVGEKLTLADVCLVVNVVGVFESGCFERAKYGKLVSYYERVKSEISCFEEIESPIRSYVKQRWSELK